MNQLDIETLRSQADICKRLNAPSSEIAVERVSLTSSVVGITETRIITKSISRELPEYHRPPSFLEEMVNYLFLSGLHDKFTYFPKLYLHNDTLIVLQDLGPDSYEYSTMDECANRLAETLVTLHIATFGREGYHKQLRKEIGLSTVDLRVWSKDEQNIFFELGLEYMTQIMSIKDCEEMFLKAKHQVNNPGVFSAFIHDDLSARRQTVSDDHHLYLVDFETGKYAHCLLDIVKPILGKVERKRKLNRYFLNNPSFPWEFTEMYKKKLFSRMEGFVNESIWEDHLQSCFIYITIANIGVALRAHELMPALTNFNDIVNEIVFRLVPILKKRDTDENNLFLEKIRLATNQQH